MAVETKTGPQLVSHQNPRLGTLFALLATACWSTTGLFIEVLNRDYHLEPVQIAFWRILLMAVVLVPVVWQRQGAAGFALTRKELGFYIVNGVIGIALFNVVWNSSVKANGAAVATTLIYCAPVFVVLLGLPILKERVGLERVLAILVNLIGCGLVAEVYNPASLFQSPEGFLLGIASGFTFALYTLMGRMQARRSHRSGFTTLFYIFLFGTLTLLPVGLAQKGDKLFFLPLDLYGWFLLAALSFGPTLLGYILFNASLKHLPAAVASLITTMEPPITAVLALVLFGKSLSLIQWLGALLIVSGVMGLHLNDLRKRQINAKVLSIPDGN